MPSILQPISYVLTILLSVHLERHIGQRCTHNMSLIKLDYTVSQSKWVSSEHIFAFRPLKHASFASSRPSSVPNPPGYLAPFTTKQLASASSKVMLPMGHKWLKLSWNIHHIACPSKWRGARKANSKIHRTEDEEGMGFGLIVSRMPFLPSFSARLLIRTIDYKAC